MSKTLRDAKMASLKDKIEALELEKAKKAEKVEKELKVKKDK